MSQYKDTIRAYEDGDNAEEWESDHVDIEALLPEGSTKAQSKRPSKSSKRMMRAPAVAEQNRSSDIAFARAVAGGDYHFGGPQIQHPKAIEHSVGQADRSQTEADALVEASVLTALIAKIFEELLVYILACVVALNSKEAQIPKQITERVSMFEDAFGRESRIDIDIIPDWFAFDFLLLHKFQGSRGLLRIQNGKYRLHEPAIGLINPSERPCFSAVFKPGGRIRMSIYFEGSEVSAGSCPRCKALQIKIVGEETVCPTCKFAYTHEPTKEYQPPSSQDERRVSRLLNANPGVTSEFKPTAEDVDRPEPFNRISIGAVKDANVRHGEPPGPTVHGGPNRQEADEHGFEDARELFPLDGEIQQTTGRIIATVRGREVDIIDLGIDLDYLSVLPEEMREDVIVAEYEARRSQDRPTDISNDFLDALPSDIRQEILDQEATEHVLAWEMERTRQEVRNINDSSYADYWAMMLDPGRRQNALLNADEETLSTFPRDIQAEARGLREESQKNDESSAGPSNIRLHRAELLDLERNEDDSSIGYESVDFTSLEDTGQDLPGPSRRAEAA